METIPNTKKINWYDKRAELLERDPEERMEVYVAHGEDENGKKYIGTAYFFCDEFDHIDEIEEIN